MEYGRQDGNTSRKITHECNMTDRNLLRITAVCSVETFDIHEVLLITEKGDLLIKGNELHMKKLDLDKTIVEVEGKIDALIYSNKGQKSKKRKIFG